MAEIKPKYDTSRAFLLLTYAMYHKLDEAKHHKGNCLNVVLSLLKYAWKKNNYECGLRHSKIAIDTGLSRSTIYRTLLLLADLTVIKMIKGRSGKTYVINSAFLNTEKTTMYKSDTRMYKSDTSNVSDRPTLEEQYNTLTNIEKIIRKGLAKDLAIKELSSLPLKELQEDKKNAYYCTLAIALKKDNERVNFVPIEKILSTLKGTAKKSNSRYIEKCNFNKRNNLDYKGNPKL